MKLMDWVKRAHEFQARAEIAEEQVRQLRAILRPEIEFPREWGLTQSQSRMLGVLGMRNEATLRALQEASKRDPTVNTDPQVVNAQICLMRPKLAPFGIKIGTSWGKGYYLTDRSREIVKAALSAVDDVEV